MSTTAAFFISPKGEIIYSGTTHIQIIIRKPEKFGMNIDVIKYIYSQYDEKVGQEGKAREQILISLFNQGWVRLRRYNQFWTVNVRRLDRKTKQYLQKWAGKLLQGRLPWKDFEGPYADVKIDQPGSKLLSSNLKAIAQSAEFVGEGKENYDVKVVYDMNELADIPLYPFAEEIMKKINEKAGGENK